MSDSGIAVRDATAAALSEAFAQCLKPGKHGDPIINRIDATSFVVSGTLMPERRFLVEVIEQEEGPVELTPVEGVIREL